MGENLSIIKAALRAVSKNSEYVPNDFIAAGGFIAEKHPEESRFLIDLGRELNENVDLFTLFDEDSNGKISLAEIDNTAQFKPANDTLDRKDLAEAHRIIEKDKKMGVSSPPKASTPLRSTSTPSSSGTRTTAISNQAPQIARSFNEIEVYAKEGYKEGKTVDRSHVYGNLSETVDLDAIKLNDTQNLKTTLGQDKLVHFTIYSGNTYSEENVVKKFTIPLTTAKSDALNSSEAVLLSFQNDDYALQDRNNPEAKEVINVLSPENVARLNKLFRDLYFKDGSFKKLQNARGVQYVQARGIQNLKLKEPGRPPLAIPPPEQYNGTIDSLDTYTDNFTKGSKAKSTLFWNGNKIQIGQLVRYTDVSSQPERKGHKFYRLFLVNDPENNKTSNSLIECDWSEDKMKEIAQRDNENVNWDNIEEVRNFLLSHFKFDKKKLEAHTNYEEGFAEFGELQVGIRESKATIAELDPNTNPSEIGSKLIEKAIENRKKAPFTTPEELNEIAKQKKDSKINSFVTAVPLPIPVDYAGIIPNDINEYVERLQYMYELKSKLPASKSKNEPENPTVLCTFELGGEIRQIVVSTGDIKIIRWEKGDSKNAKISYLKRSQLAGPKYSRFKKLTPAVIENNDTEVLENYIKSAKTYFGYYPIDSSKEVTLEADLKETKTAIAQYEKSLESGKKIR